MLVYRIGPITVWSTVVLIGVLARDVWATTTWYVALVVIALLEIVITLVRRRLAG